MVCVLRRFSLVSMRNMLNLLKMPEICSAKRIMIIPPTISMVLLCMSKDWPIEPMTAPNNKNTTENPSANRIAWGRIFIAVDLLEGSPVDLSVVDVFVVVPLMYAKYAGINGRMQGDRMDRIPATKAIDNVGCMSPYYFLFLFFQSECEFECDYQGNY